MKTTFRTLALAGVFALMTAVAVVPAHASTGGSSPRPTSGTN